MKFTTHNTKNETINTGDIQFVRLFLVITHPFLFYKQLKLIIVSKHQNGKMNKYVSIVI